MKYLLVTDTHLGLHNSSDVWHEVVLDLFKEIHDTCIREGISQIIHLGDFFHTRRQINVKTQEYAQKIADLFDNGGFTLNIIIGNHDTYYKNRLYPTSLSLFRKYPHIEIIDEVTSIPCPRGDGIMMAPWGADISGYRCKYLMGHFEINGFYMNSSAVCSKGVEKESFREFDRVFSGHFHTPSTDSNVTYLGSPFQQTFHDVGSARGFYIFDNVSGELEFIKNERAPKFLVHHTEYPELPEIKGNVIKLIFDKDYGTTRNNEIVEEVLSHRPLQLRSDFSNIADIGTEEEIEESVSELIDNQDILRLYVHKIKPPENIKRSTVISMMDKLIEDLKS